MSNCSGLKVQEMGINCLLVEVHSFIQIMTSHSFVWCIIGHHHPPANYTLLLEALFQCLLYFATKSISDVAVSLAVAFFRISCKEKCLCKTC